MASGSEMTAWARTILLTIAGTVQSRGEVKAKRN